MSIYRFSRASVLTVAAIFLPLFCLASEAISTPTAMSAETDQPSRILYVWARDQDQAIGGTDFLATINADPESDQYGTVISTSPIDRMGTGAHHAEPVAPAEGPLLASGFRVDRTFLFDLSNPSSPKREGELEEVEGLSYSHDYRRLPDGRILMTMQRGDGSAPGDPGGLALLDKNANLLQTASAADPRFPGALIRPYSLDIAVAHDRILTTGRSMFFRQERVADVIQIWRLSDLKLLKTISVLPIEEPEQPECVLGVGVMCDAQYYSSEQQPFEIRVLGDGSALLNTFTCGIYRVPDITADSPQLEPVLNYPDLLGCSIPSIKGDFLILPVMFSRTILTIDISQPDQPREVSRFDTPERFLPHWTAADPRSNRIVVSPDGPSDPAVAILRIDPETGVLSIDREFGKDESSIGISFARDIWPHGQTGPAIPHASLFGQ
jgi:hypothetical protein